MPKAKPIAKEKPLFELSNAEYAKKVVFELKRSIRFEEIKGTIKGRITVTPDGHGGAEMKCQAWPVWSIKSKSLTIVCIDEEDFECSFEKARMKTIAKMEEMLKIEKAKKPIK